MIKLFKKNVVLSACVFLFCFGSIQSESSNPVWGEEEGSLDWKSAIEKCKSNGMRMPTKAELLNLYKTKEFKKWNANWYWTGEESDKERAWAVVLNVGAILHIPKRYHNNVRCVSL